ncbi:glycosyltransferase [Chloroflexota bacterium]
MNRLVSLIVPTYKERDNITPLVERVHNALSNRDYKIFLIDDNSNDGTAELVADLSQRYPVDVIIRKDKRGLASAVVDGLNYATGEVIVVMDADLQHPPEVLPELLKAIDDGADMAIASRYVRGGGCQGWGLVRRVISKGATFLAHVLLPPTRPIKDPMSGFFAFDKRAIAGADLNPTGYKIILEVLMQGNFQNVAEVPFVFRTRSRGESKLNARQQIDYLKHVYSLMKRTGELLRFIKFCGVGLSGVGVNEGLLWFLRESAGLPLPVSSAISIETSIISNFLLNNFFTFRDRRSPEVKATFGRLLKFNLVSLAGLGINLGILLLLTDVFGVYYLVSNLCGIAVAALWNYTLSTWWTWR